MNIAIILAAGNSKRMGGVDKIFYQIRGKPLIFYTISVFEKHPKIRKIILVVKKRVVKKFSDLIRKYRFRKISAIIGDGKERQDSAFNGLKAAENLGAKPKDLILFHNGANPLILKEEVNEAIKAAKKYKAALVGQFARDTIKEVGKNNFVVKTLNRKKVFLAQTPQVIEYQLAKKAFEKASAKNFYGTDDVSLVERLGKRVKIVQASTKNIKVTYPEDLRFIESQL